MGAMAVAQYRKDSWMDGGARKNITYKFYVFILKYKVLNSFFLHLPRLIFLYLLGTWVYLMEKISDKRANHKSLYKTTIDIYIYI